MTRGWRRLHSEELHNLYASTHIIRIINSRRMKWVGYVAHTGKMRNAYSILIGKPEEKRPLGKPQYRLSSGSSTSATKVGFLNLL
jgi:hypothetical protein